MRSGKTHNTPGGGDWGEDGSKGLRIRSLTPCTLPGALRDGGNFLAKGAHTFPGQSGSPGQALESGRAGSRAQSAAPGRLGTRAPPQAEGRG